MQLAGEADQAIEKYRMALSLNPNNAMAHKRLGFLLLHAKKQTREALEQSQAAVRLCSRILTMASGARFTNSGMLAARPGATIMGQPDWWAGLPLLRDRR